jgi:hypothetical protein
LTFHSLQVLFVKDSLAIISGLNADAPLGTKLTFVTGGIGCVVFQHKEESWVLAAKMQPDVSGNVTQQKTVMQACQHASLSWMPRS